MIDTSKIRPGDEVTITATVVARTDKGMRVSFRWPDENPPLGTLNIHSSMVASHTPAPWVPEPTDVVTIMGGSGPEWRIIAIDGEAIWLGLGEDHMTTTAKYLTLIRKGAA